MKCPFCGRENDKVTESRVTENSRAVRRRRECLACGKRFTSYERIEERALWVIKKNGKKEAFDREKLLSGVLRACHKLSIPMDKIEKMVSEVEEDLHNTNGSVVKSSQIGEITLIKLQKLNQVAYVRFASVYKQFKNVKEFIKVVKEVAR